MRDRKGAKIRAWTDSRASYVQRRCEWSCGFHLDVCLWFRSDHGASFDGDRRCRLSALGTGGLHQRKCRPTIGDLTEHDLKTYDHENNRRAHEEQEDAHALSG
jgi:hypothetical protein